MTCIVGLISQGRIYMGADSAGVSGSDLSVRQDKKVFIKDDFLMGFTSSFRMGQLIRYDMHIPDRPRDKSTFAYMVVNFINALRASLRTGGCIEEKDEVETCGVFLVGYAGRLFRIDNDFHVGERTLPYNACGCGWSYALGSLHSSAQDNPELKILEALEAAYTFCAGVRPPFIVKSISI